jgi:hypothetical protein
MPDVIAPAAPVRSSGITAESIASGEDRLLSSVRCGMRGIFFVRQQCGNIAIVTATVDACGHPVDVRSVTRFPEYRLAEIAHAIRKAQTALEGGVT